jgi:hypothetical protein
VNLYFIDEPEKYQIDGFDYTYINYPAFEDSIKKDDTVTIGVKGKNILTLEKNGVPYMQFDKAQYHKTRNEIFFLGLFGTGLVCCLIPLFFSTQPTLKINRQEIPIEFGWILLLCLGTAFIILYNKVGIQFITNDRFAK